MSDILVSFSNNVPNTVLAALYENVAVRSEYFSGTLDVGGAKIAWNVESAPTVILERPTVEQWKNSIDETGEAPTPDEHAFLMHAAKIKLTGADGKTLLTFSLDAIFRAFCVKSELRFSLRSFIKSTVGMSSKDAVMYTGFLKSLAKRFIPSVDEISFSPLKDIDIPGVSFGSLPLSLVMAKERMGIYCDLPGKTPGKIPPLPTGSFQLLLGPDIIRAAASYGLNGIVGKNYSTSGSKGFAVGKASYSCGVKIDSARIDSLPQPNEARCRIAVTPRANAKLKLILSSVSIGYSGNVKPNPVGAVISIVGSGRDIKAKIREVGQFSILLSPSGNTLSKILSSVAWPLAEIMVSLLTPKARGLVEGFTFDAVKLDTVSFKACKKTVHIRPDNLTIGKHEGMLNAGVKITASVGN